MTRLTSAEQALIEAAEAWLDDCVDEDDLPEIMVIATCDALVAAVRALRLEREDNRDTYKALEEEGWDADEGVLCSRYVTVGTDDCSIWMGDGDRPITVCSSEASCVRLARSLSSLLEELP